MRMFTTGAFSDADRRAMHHQTMQHTNDRYREANTTHWMEHELRQYPRADLDIDALATRTDKLIVAAGRESRGHLTHRVSEALAARLGTDVLELPGGHVGCITQPTEFAAELLHALAWRPTPGEAGASATRVSAAQRR
jgi:hypothetical protein